MDQRVGPTGLIPRGKTGKVFAVLLPRVADIKNGKPSFIETCRNNVVFVTGKQDAGVVWRCVAIDTLALDLNLVVGQQVFQRTPQRLLRQPSKPHRLAAAACLRGAG